MAPGSAADVDADAGVDDGTVDAERAGPAAVDDVDETTPVDGTDDEPKPGTAVVDAIVLGADVGDAPSDASDPPDEHAPVARSATTTIPIAIARLRPRTDPS